MARSTNTRQPPKEGLSEELKRRLREAGALLLLPLALYLLVCLFSYNPHDPSWTNAGQLEHARNFGGTVGAYIADLLRWIFGLVAYCFPLLLLLLGVQVLRQRGEQVVHPWEPALRLVGFVFFFITGPALLYLNFHDEPVLPQGVGGIIGVWVGDALLSAFGDKGAPLLLLALFLIAVTLATGLSWFKVMDWTGQGVLKLADWLKGKLREAPQALAARQARTEREVVKKADAVRQAKREPVRIEAPPAPVTKSERARLETQIPLFVGAAAPGELPPLSLLDEAPPQGPGYSEETLEVLSRQVEFKLKDFRIDVKVVGAYPGPVITRFEMEPAPGVRGSQVSSLDKDIARGLSVVSVRVVDVIPGKNVIGLEIPNTNKQIVYLSEILRSDKYDQAKSPLSLALGKDIGGKPVVVDLGKMPHLLVAGTTGSGKSVAVNAMVLSLLYKAGPKDVRIILNDKKILELRLILDQSGAEALLGHGDMLYLPPGTATPERVHGAFVDDHEVHGVVAWLKAQGAPQYVEGVLEEVQATSDGKFINDAGLPQEGEEGGDADAQLYDKAVAIVTQTRRASISGVQRHLRIGYNRAARLIEQMEQDGVVSAPQHNGNREVLAPPPPKN